MISDQNTRVIINASGRGVSKIGIIQRWREWKSLNENRRHAISRERIGGKKKPTTFFRLKDNALSFTEI